MRFRYLNYIEIVISCVKYNQDIQMDLPFKIPLAVSHFSGTSFSKFLHRLVAWLIEFCIYLHSPSECVKSLSFLYIYRSELARAIVTYYAYVLATESGLGLMKCHYSNTSHHQQWSPDLYAGARPALQSSCYSTQLAMINASAFVPLRYFTSI